MATDGIQARKLDEVVKTEGPFAPSAESAAKPKDAVANADKPKDAATSDADKPKDEGTTDNVVPIANDDKPKDRDGNDIELTSDVTPLGATTDDVRPETVAEHQEKESEKQYVILATMFGYEHGFGDVMPESEMGGPTVIEARLRNRTIAELGSKEADEALASRAFADEAKRRAGVL